MSFQEDPSRGGPSGLPLLDVLLFQRIPSGGFLLEDPSRRIPPGVSLPEDPSRRGPSVCPFRTPLPADGERGMSGESHDGEAHAGDHQDGEDHAGRP